MSGSGVGWSSHNLRGYHLARALYDMIRERPHNVEFHSGAYVIEDPSP